MSGSDQEWGGAGGKRKCSKAEVSRDAELQTEKGTPVPYPKRAGGSGNATETPGSDPV